MKKTIIQTIFYSSVNGIFNRLPGLSPAGLEPHLVAAIDWLLYAQSMNHDGGISASYKLLKNQWTPSYPETTGYIIPTLFRFSKRTGCNDIRDAALRMAEYELKTQLDEGGFPYIREREAGEFCPVAFDTGQVIFGLITAADETGDNRFLHAAHLAADWLVDTQAKDGSWEDYTAHGSALTIDTRVAWPLVLMYERVKNRAYLDASRRQLEWVLEQQHPNGWFQHCSFNSQKPPITHTLAYTIEGLLESGLLLGESHYITAAQKAADALLLQSSPAGFLAGAFNDQWIPTVSWSCLTGSAQMALIWLRLAEITGSSKYRSAAECTIKFVASTQYLNGLSRDVRGGIAGSWPVYGGYMSYKYPNWAAKFFADAVMVLQDV